MKFSIITCTYNSERHLQENIDSVKNQIFRDFEHIFIDGFSTDNTIEIIKKYQEEFPDRVSSFQFPTKGISNAMNQGIEKASGEYLIHLHSDDSFYDDSALQNATEFIDKNSEPDWVYGKINVIEENNTSIGIFPKNRMLQLGGNIIGKYLLKFINFIPHQAVFIKKKILKKSDCFDETIRSSMDYDLWLKIRNKTNWFFLDKIISNYRIRPDAQSSGKKNKKENEYNVKIVQKRYLNNIELFFSTIINAVIRKINKTLR